MPIELPNLDDKSYADLVEEARSAIPGIYPAWTDHNPSDPGMVLIELFAWLTEMSIYRTGRIPDQNVRTFLRILDGPPAAPSIPEGVQVPLEDAIRSTIGTLRERWRGATTEDYEYLAMHQWPGSPLVRVRCLAERNLSGSNPRADAPGHVSLMIVPGKKVGGTPWDPPELQLVTGLGTFFRDRQLVTTRLHIVGPVYVPLQIATTVYLRDDVRPDEVKDDLKAKLVEFFDPRTGGRGGEGWPFDRDIYDSDIYAMLDNVSSVEFVRDVAITPQGLPAAVHVDLAPHELPRVQTQDILLTLKERRGDQWVTVL